MSEFDPNQVDWGRIYAEALEIAHGMRSGDPEDVVQQGMTLLLEGTAAYEADGETTLAEHLVEVGLAARRNRERVDRLRRRPKVVAKLSHWMDGEPPTPEELTDARKDGDRAFEAMLAACDGDAEVHALLLLSRRDIDEPADQATELGWDIETVRNARKRMGRVLASVRATMSGDRREEP